MASKIILLSASCLSLAVVISGLTYPIVDTGVTDLYTDSAKVSSLTAGQSYYGQDGNYAGNSPSYQDNGDGTVTDLVTGLQWQQTMSSKMTYTTAATYVTTLTLGGYSDWRIPSVKELFSLIQFTGDVMGITAGTKRFIDTTYFVQPIGNTSAGEREIDAQTLSGTQYTSTIFTGQNCMFGVNFVDGRVKCYQKSSSFYFRFVRGNTAYGVNSFTANADNTITDSATGLIWQKYDSGSAMDWMTALAYCEALTLAGYSDWRLPNIKELQSIVDYTRSPKANATAAINPLFSVSTVSEPDGSTDYPYFWSGTTLKDGPTLKYASYIAFGRAYGMPTTTLLDVHGAGAERTDPKSTSGGTYPQYFGPQMDMQVVNNYARCVRNA